jgi:exodeoxyribonuclease X
MTGITQVVVVDTETPDKVPDEKCSILEFAWVPLQLELGLESADWTYGAGGASFVEYVGPVSPGARGTHHLRDEQFAPGAPNCLPRDVLLHDHLCAQVPGEMCYAAHNAPFDMGFLPELVGTIPWIDTLQCARHIWPDSPDHKNQTLRYYLDVQPNPIFLTEEADVVLVTGTKDGYSQKAKGRGMVELQAHRALYDTAVTAAVLKEMLARHTPEELVALSTTPLLLKTCHLKKFRGVPWSEVPRDYLRWITTTDMLKDDPNLAHTVRHYLEH